VSETGSNISRKILVFTAIVEVATGLALIAVPAIVIALLLGVSASSEGAPLGRFLGIALLAFGWACWPDRRNTKRGSRVFQGVLIYNVLVAFYLAFLDAVGGMGGLLLWPAVVLHGGVAAVMGWTWRAEGQLETR
jgi:hypothetical protein